MNFVQANGAKIPAIGLGTMTLMDAVCVEAVETALRLGYRHIDTAERYRNESEVGEGLRRGLRAAGLAREDVFVTTKVWYDQLATLDFQRSLDQSLKKLELSWVDLHPFIDQDKVLAACRKYGLAVTAYCPLARGKVPENELLARTGKAHGKTAAQIALRYLVQQGITPIPRTAKPDHLATNLTVFDFKLSDAEMTEIARLKQTHLRVVDPPHAPQWDN